MSGERQPFFNESDDAEDVQADDCGRQNNPICGYSAIFIVIETHQHIFHNYHPSQTSGRPSRVVNLLIGGNGGGNGAESWSAHGQF